MRHLSDDQMLLELRARGASRLSKVTFRANRSTIWSLTQDATVLNLHAAYRCAPDELLDAFAAIARARGRGTTAVRKASRIVREWSGVSAAVEAARREWGLVNGYEGCDVVRPRTRCSATPEQRAYLRSLFAYLNATRFGGALPADIPVRLSNRMSTSLGHVIVGGEGDGHRHVVEIALSVDLMLAGNGAERFDTLLHEMAHAADWLFEGNHGHGASWKAWATRVGCRADVRYDRPYARRRRKGGNVTRVPPLPSALWLPATGDDSVVEPKEGFRSGSSPLPRPDRR